MKALLMHKQYSCFKKLSKLVTAFIAANTISMLVPSFAYPNADQLSNRAQENLNKIKNQLKVQIVLPYQFSSNHRELEDVESTLQILASPNISYAYKQFEKSVSRTIQDNCVNQLSKACQVPILKIAL